MPTHTSAVLTEAAAAKPIPRLSPTSKPFILATVCGVAVAFLAAFLLSAQSELWAAAQIHVEPWAAFALPLAVDAPLLLFALSAAARQARGEAVWPAYSWIGFFTLASVGINIWRNISEATPATTLLTTWGGICLSALIPVVILATSAEVLKILVAAPVGSVSQRAALAKIADRGQLNADLGNPRKGTIERAAAVTIARDFRAGNPSISKAALAKKTGASPAVVDEAFAFSL